MRVSAVAALGAALAGAPAHASEFHIGAMAHNICVLECKNAGKEDGANIELQFSFDSPAFLRWAGSPQPYLLASVNTAGDTSYAGVGLEWDWEFAEGWSLEPGIGYVAHDGETSNPFPNGSPEAAAFADDHVLLGSRDLFRTSLALTRDLAGPWEAQLLFMHLSHGQILGDGRNQGLDQIGVRAGYAFGG